VAEVEAVARQIIDLVQQLSPSVALGTWLIQTLYNRKVKHKLLIEQVVGLLRGWGLSEAETTLIKNLSRVDPSGTP
jgi:hypothetical protein